MIFLTESTRKVCYAICRWKIIGATYTAAGVFWNSVKSETLLWARWVTWVPKTPRVLETFFEVQVLVALCQEVDQLLRFQMSVIEIRLVSQIQAPLIPD